MSSQDFPYTFVLLWITLHQIWVLHYPFLHLFQEQHTFFEGHIYVYAENHKIYKVIILQPFVQILLVFIVYSFRVHCVFIVCSFEYLLLIFVQSKIAKLCIAGVTFLYLGSVLDQVLA